MPIIEEETYLVLDVDTPFGPDYNISEVNATFMDFDTSEPVMFLNGTAWAGEYHDTVGSDLLFVNPNQDDVEIKLSGVSYKQVKFIPVMVMAEDKTDEHVKSTNDSAQPTSEGATTVNNEQTGVDR
ncbi:hypothetical protein SARC_00346 [Sphaeroforma arctica JP610]|uniref:Transcription factor TFIIIC triple barrel domain-containing protein n=1 Tax=Sphaeroforma arctica JP610 TaxID=667725 RepID=A0A0L0GET5_9EUKA|nr:hypothetical protein SARC_00346 [Sphaeroforma arctica JP610]KNC87522.1 hypothetical protein SARC_00346 [Sphaeroforma arctica JP610]|eukprot:XP_014161424.1 hypothetical protein SARC_00346 [Sphaeroforma arctica JP610]